MAERWGWKTEITAAKETRTKANTGAFKRSIQLSLGHEQQDGEAGKDRVCVFVRVQV